MLSLLASIFLISNDTLAREGGSSRHGGESSGRASMSRAGSTPTNTRASSGVTRGRHNDHRGHRGSRGGYYYGGYDGDYYDDGYYGGDGAWIAPVIATEAIAGAAIAAENE